LSFAKFSVAKFGVAKFGVAKFGECKTPNIVKKLKQRKRGNPSRNDE